MKKTFTIIISIILVLSMAACSKSEGKSDLDYVMEKGVLVVGVTEFEPMDYLDKNGEWVGFDADLAAAFAESLGIKAEFVKIEWANKSMELSGKTVDCIWNDDLKRRGKSGNGVLKRLLRKCSDRDFAGGKGRAIQNRRGYEGACFCGGKRFRRAKGGGGSRL